MINKLDSCLAFVNFVNHSYDCRPNWTPLGPITIIYLLGVITDDEMCSWGRNLGSGVLCQAILVVWGKMENDSVPNSSLKSLVWLSMSAIFSGGAQAPYAVN